jgi:glutaminyl-tRNA synthetase
LTNYPKGQVEFLEAVNNPEDADMGTRSVPFGGELWIDQEDFREAPPKGYHRLYPGNEVRLRYGYIVKCHDFVKDPATGEITEIHCTYDPQTHSGQSRFGSMTSCSPPKIQMRRRKVKTSLCT